METRLRWLLLEAGLPKPEVQRNLHDASGRFVGRADLYYPAARLVIEYDGTNHRDRLIEDNRRQNLMVRAGYRLLRFTAADVLQRPAGVVALVRDQVLLLADRVRLPEPVRHLIIDFVSWSAWEPGCDALASARRSTLCWVQSSSPSACGLDSRRFALRLTASSSPFLTRRFGVCQEPSS